MKLVKNIVSLFLLVAVLTSCATFMHGTRQTVGIASNPSRANVWLDHQFVGCTPMIVNLTRNDNHVVRIELDGYEPYEAIFCKKLSFWVFGNVIFGGFIGLAVDVVTGGIYVLTPEQVQAEMRLNNMVCSSTSTESYVGVVLQPNPAWKKVGNLSAVN